MSARRVPFAPLVVAPLVVAALGLGGCTATVGGHGSQVPPSATGGAPAATGSASTGASGPPSADVSALVQQGFDALGAAKGVHIRTTVTGSNSGTIDMQYGTAVAIGTINTGSAPVEIRRTPSGRYYLKGPAAFWSSTGVSSAAVAALAGKFVHVPSGATEIANIVDLLDLTTFVGSLRDQFHFQSASLTGTRTLGGVAVYQIGDEGTDDGALYLAVAGEHEPVRIVSTQNGTITFDGYGQAPDVTEPPANQVVELPG